MIVLVFVADHQKKLAYEYDLSMASIIFFAKTLATLPATTPQGILFAEKAAGKMLSAVHAHSLTSAHIHDLSLLRSLYPSDASSRAFWILSAETDFYDRTTWSTYRVRRDPHTFFFFLIFFLLFVECCYR